MHSLAARLPHVVVRHRQLNGISKRAIAKQLGVSRTSVIRLLRSRKRSIDDSFVRRRLVSSTLCEKGMNDLPDKTATIHRGHFSRVNFHPPVSQRNNAVSQQTLAPSTTALPSQIQPAVLGSGF